MTKVSIIVPVYKVEKYLDRCVQSLINQTLKDIEIILVDDGSPDRCPALCEEYASKDARIKVIHKDNGGLGFARNSGLDIAKSEFVAFCDSDDRVKEDSYEILYNKMVCSNADIVYGWLIHEMRDGHWEDYCKFKDETIIQGKEVTDFALNLVSFPPKEKSRERIIDVSACMALYRRSIIEENNIRFKSEREIGSEDMLFSLEYLLQCRKVVLIPFSFYYYYHNCTSLSSTFKIEKFDCFKKLRTLLKEQLMSLDPKSFRANRVIIGYTRAHLTSLICSNQTNKIGIIKNVLADDVWKDIQQYYKPSYLPLHARVYYLLTISNMPYILFIYGKLYYFIKKILHKAE